MGVTFNDELTEKQLDIIGGGLEGHDFISVAKMKEKENVERYLDPMGVQDAREFLKSLVPKQKN